MKWKAWIKAAGIRAVRTFAEAALAYIGTGKLLMGEVNWLAVLSAGAFGAVISILMALTGLPEVEMEYVDVTPKAETEEENEDRRDGADNHGRGISP